MSAGNRLYTGRIWSFEISKPKLQRRWHVRFEFRKLKIMDELPQEDRERIDADHDEILIEPIAEILYRRERPWYTRDQIRIRLKEEYNNDVSNPTIDDRLDDLLELELIKRKRIGQTDIFYYYSDKSEWPIPPDTEVEAVDDEMTVSEFFGKTYVQWAGMGVLAVLLGGIIMWVGSLQASNAISLPFNTGEIIAVGLLTFLLSYGLLLIAVLVGILDFAVDVEPPESLT